MISNIQNIHTSVVNSTFIGSVVKPSDVMDFFNMEKKITRSYHGMTNHPLYSVHTDMIRRCYNKTSKNYKHYGGRGIEVSNNLKDVKYFIAYASSLPDYDKKFSDGYSLDRIDNSKWYEEGNLRWASKSIQNANRRNNKSDTGYTGVHKWGNKYTSEVFFNKKSFGRKSFYNISDAVNYRNNTIITNNLPHKIQKLKI